MFVSEIETPPVDWDNLPVEKHSGRRVWVRSWSEYHQDCRQVALKLEKLAKERYIRWWGVLSIARGGMTFGQIVARELGLRMVETLSLSLYNDTNSSGRQVQVLLPINPHFVNMAKEYGGRGLLVLDDLVETRQTNSTVRHQLGVYASDAHYATVYAKAGAETAVDTYLVRVPDPMIWVRHPWDTDFVPGMPMAGSDGL